MKKRINILYTVWGMSYGGAERFVLNLVKRLDKAKYNVVIFSDNRARGPMQCEFEKYGAKVIYANAHRFKHPVKYIRQLRHIISAEQIDIIHANDDCNMIFPLLAKTKNVKFIAHSHSTSFLFTKIKLLSDIATKIILNYVAKKSDARLACGKGAGEAMYGNAGYKIIPNSVEVEKFRFSKLKRSSLRKKYSITDDEIVLLHIGRLSKEKNQSFLIDFFAKYHEMNPKSRLFIVGDGPNGENIRSKIMRRGLEKSILLLHPRSNVADLYNLADAFVLPSLYEGFPIVLIEAQANGLPVIASSNIGEETKINPNFRFLDLRDGTDVWARVVGEISRERVAVGAKINDFSIKKIFSDVEEIYTGCLSEGMKK